MLDAESAKIKMISNLYVLVLINKSLNFIDHWGTSFTLFRVLGSLEVAKMRMSR